MKEAFLELAVSANKLNNHMKDIDAHIKSVEDQLAQMQVGVQIWCEEPIIFGEAHYYLGYTKFDKKWQIVVKHNDRIRPVLSSNKYVRIQSIRYIRPMIYALTDKVNEYAQKTEEAVERMDQNINKQGVKDYIKLLYDKAGDS